MTLAPDVTECEALLASIDTGRALPSDWYTDPALYRREVDRIHRRAWHYVTHVGDLAEPGDQFLWQIAGVPIVLVRDRSGELRGFVNICRHRGHPVVMEAGNRKVLQCHYHGWSYNLDGGLLRAPRSQMEPEFDTSELGLVPVQTYVWGPMVWVNVDPGAPSFPEWIEGMPELMRERGCDVSEFVHAFEHTWAIDSNWKVFQDNTIECYHCPTTHRDLCKALVMDPREQILGIGGRYWIHHRIPFHDEYAARLTDKFVPGEPWFYYYNWIFPTTYLQHYGRGFDIGTLEVLGVDRMRFRHIVFLSPGTPEEELSAGHRRLVVDTTIQEDVEICGRVQQAHAAGIAPPGRLLPTSEFLVQHFQRLVVEMVAAR